uniref:F-box domain-containing protein n=1 Tax=Glycine max TaxID=3847 RepID=A0A0R0FP47_SOYBN
MEGSSGSTANDSSTRKQNLLKRHKINEGEGTLSKLPEPLVSHILSFLPTKDAVRTSVLSKKWQFRWTFITKLDLDDTVFYKRKSGGKMYFVNFVYRALLLTKSSSLESFSLVIANKYDVFLLNTWICNILIRDIKNLCIVTQSEMSFSAHASHSLFNSRLLEELVLKTMHSFAIRVTESVVQFEHLKLLKLSGILFSLDFNSKHLTLSLPVLKVFETLNCTWLNAKRITLKVPLLESVIITQDTKPPSYVKPHCAFEFSASHLKEFSYCGCGYISHYFKLLDTSSAHNASLNITVNQCPINRDPETEVRAFLLLKQFSQVKYLKFEGCQGISNFDKELLNSAAVPECLTSTLQVVKFHKLHGCEHELCLAKFVMENGLVLERMSFFLASHCLGKSKIMEEFKAKLFSFKKGFSFAIVEFSYDD